MVSEPRARVSVRNLNRGYDLISQATESGLVDVVTGRRLCGLIEAKLTERGKAQDVRPSNDSRASGHIECRENDWVPAPRSASFAEEAA